MTIKTTLALLTALALTGCQSTSEPVEPREFDTNASYAYNIANQTALTRNQSPLRDFTQEEVNDIQTKLTRPSGAEASVVLGSLSVLTGNLTGLVNVAGGGAAYLANSDHMASKARWIIALPKENYPSAEAAVEYARAQIRQSQEHVYSKLGVVEEKRNEKTKATYLTVSSNNKTIPIGGVVSTKRTPLVTEGLFMGEMSYLIGFDTEPYPSFMKPTDPLLAAIELSLTKDVTDEVYSELTMGLDDNFFLYVPSFRKTSALGKSYTSTQLIVPVIYTQGKKHEFVKPE